MTSQRQHLEWAVLRSCCQINYARALTAHTLVVFYTFDVVLQPLYNDYDPKHFLRCHFCDREALRKGHKQDDPTDSTTKIWCCQFEPNALKQGACLEFLIAPYS